MTIMLAQRIQEATEFVAGRIGVRPRLAIVLGSGLSRLVEAVESRVAIPYAEIPHFPAASVAGHPGNLVFGRLEGVEVALMQGRLHYYESRSMADVTFPIRLLGSLGVATLVETCAVGALKADFFSGELAVVVDHINLMGDNPLIGEREVEPRFVEMMDAYSPALRSFVREVAEEAGIPLRQGVYAAVSGPSYETPAEVRFLSGIANFVGMSLVPEVIVARQLGMEVAAVAVVTNAHEGGYGVSHQRVLEIADGAEADLEKLVVGLVARIGSRSI